jgi:ferritin-like metal-binding protein YciE
VAIIAACQAVQHYETTQYGTLVVWVEEFGHDNDAQGRKKRGQEVDHRGEEESQPQSSELTSKLATAVQAAFGKS